MELRKQEKLATYYAIFLIAAVFPQIIKINGSSLDTVWKVVIVLFFLYETCNWYNIRKVSRFTVVYTLTLVGGTICTCINNSIFNLSVYMGLIINILLFMIFYVVAEESNIENIENIFKFYKIYVVFILIASLYNMITHFNVLLHLTSVNVYGGENISAFFDNKNSFGIYLMFGCLGATILQMKTKQKRWLLASIIFIVNELMAMCRTAIVLSIILIILTYILSGNRNILFRVLLIGAIVGCFIFLFNRNEILNNYILNNLFGSTTSLDARNNYIQNMEHLLTGKETIFGYGSSKAGQLAVQYTGNKYFHNTYLKILMQGGLFSMFLLIASIWISILNIVKIIKYNKQIGIFCFVSILVYCIYAYVEAIVLFDTPVISMVATLFTMTMPLLFRRTLERRARINNGKEI